MLIINERIIISLSIHESPHLYSSVLGEKVRPLFDSSAPLLDEGVLRMFVLRRLFSSAYVFNAPTAGPPVPLAKL